MTVETFGIEAVNIFSETIVERIFKYIKEDPVLWEKYQILQEEYGDEYVKERLIRLISNHFGKS